MALQDTFFSRENRFALGTQTNTGKPYLSIPVSNNKTDYDEFYSITDEQYQQFMADESSALPFVDECRRREHDDLLLMQPGSDRGVPR